MKTVFLRQSDVVEARTEFCRTTDALNLTPFAGNMQEIGYFALHEVGTQNTLARLREYTSYNISSYSTEG
jgi:hypothetical protein